MAKFSFISNGQTYEIEGPAGATEAQAKAVFDKQLSTGSLVGLKPGDFINAATQAQAGLKSAVAQLGAGAESAIKSLSTQLPNLGNVSVVNPINISSFVKQTVGQVKIGTLNPTQVQGLVSQAAAQVNQVATALTDAKGLGKFGLNATQLEQTGLVKPGTAKLLAATGASLSSILNSPAVWTGKNGVTDVTSLLSNEKLQSGVQQQLMKTGLDKLNQLGAITKDLDPAKLGPVLNNAAKFGADTAKAWLNGNAPAGVVNQLNNLAKGSIFAQGFAGLFAAVSGGGSPLQSAIKQIKGFENTVNRSTVNQGTKAVIGNPKIPAPNYTTPKPVERLPKLDITSQVVALLKEKEVADLEYTNLYGRFASAFANSQVDILGPDIISGLAAVRSKYLFLLARATPLVTAAENASLVDVFSQIYRAKLAIESNIILIKEIMDKIQKRIDAIKAGN